MALDLSEFLKNFDAVGFSDRISDWEIENIKK